MLNNPSIEYVEADNGAKGLEQFKKCNGSMGEDTINLILTDI